MKTGGMPMLRILVVLLLTLTVSPTQGRAGATGLGLQKNAASGPRTAMTTWLKSRNAER